MSALSETLTFVFEELKRICLGDHAAFLRNDAHTFLEVHSSGRKVAFTSHVAALMPDVVIKLRTPHVVPIISAVVSQEGHPVLQDPRTQFYVADQLTDIIGLVKHQKAAVLREDATLVSWAHDLRTALCSLRQVYNDLLATATDYDAGRSFDSTTLLSDDAPDGTSLFEQFINDYEPSGLSGDKFQSPLPLVSAAVNALQPLGSLDSVNAVDKFLSPSHRAQKVDTPSTTTSQSPMWSDSPSGITTWCASAMRINSPPQSLSLASSPEYFSRYPSPSTASSGTESTMSTPPTISPSVLSSRSSTGSPSLSVLAEPLADEQFGEPSFHHLFNFSQLHVSSPPPSSPVTTTNSPTKRKRAKSESQEAQMIQSTPTHSSPKPHLRRSSRSVSPKAAKQPAARGIKPLPPSGKSRKTSTPLLFAPKPALCPLPGRTLRSTRRSSVASVVNNPLEGPFTKESHGEVCYDEECGHEHSSDCTEMPIDDCHSALEVDSDDEKDGEYRPSKRLRNVDSASGRSTSSASSVKRKVEGPKVGAAKNSRRKTQSTFSKKKTQSQKEEKEGCCKFCQSLFGRGGDATRHEDSACPENPNKVKVQCPHCFKPLSRTDAVRRHMNTGCKVYKPVISILTKTRLRSSRSKRSSV